MLFRLPVVFPVISLKGNRQELSIGCEFILQRPRAIKLFDYDAMKVYSWYTDSLGEKIELAYAQFQEDLPVGALKTSGKHSLSKESLVNGVPFAFTNFDTQVMALQSILFFTVIFAVLVGSPLHGSRVSGLPHRKLRES